MENSVKTVTNSAIFSLLLLSLVSIFLILNQRNAPTPGVDSTVDADLPSWDNTNCGTCTDNIVLADCYNTDYPVLGGVDVVEYFNHADEGYTSFQGTQGDSSITTFYHGYTFQFSSATNKNLFDLNPSKYAPSWGGFCSWGVSSGPYPYFDHPSYLNIVLHRILPHICLFVVMLRSFRKLELLDHRK